MSTARDGAQALMASLFALPTTSSDDGPLAQLPPPTTQLPRAKPLPKPKPPTKWEQFAKAKGIQHKKRDKRVWDEEKQEWVNRWGWKGANKDKEVQWATEVPANAGTSLTSSRSPRLAREACSRIPFRHCSLTDVDYDPSKAARDERKARVAKNERQRLQNLARGAANTADRKTQIDRTLAVTRTSTASMGRFDRTLEGEKKLKGVKRKVGLCLRSGGHWGLTDIVAVRPDGSLGRSRKVSEPRHLVKTRQRPRGKKGEKVGRRR